jgi:hypothetical protein
MALGLLLAGLWFSFTPAASAHDEFCDDPDDCALFCAARGAQHVALNTAGQCTLVLGSFPINNDHNCLSFGNQEPGNFQIHSFHC